MHQFFGNAFAALGVSLASYELWIASLNSGLTVVIYVLTIIWLAVQCWSKIKLTKKEIHYEKKEKND